MGINFRQKATGGDVEVSIDLSGFDENGSEKHGFHIHTNPELTNQCSDAGGHFNPEGVDHSGRDSSLRHCGDLGNIVRDGEDVETTFFDDRISLKNDAACYFIGRSIVINQDEDDLGLGGHSDSLTTGHAGKRIGCCEIKEGSPSIWKNWKHKILKWF